MPASSTTAISLDIFFCTTTTVFVMIRLFAGIRLPRSYGAIEVLILISWACYVGTVSIHFINYKAGFLEPIKTVRGSAGGSNVDYLPIIQRVGKEGTIRFFKRTYAELILSSTVVIFTKAAFCVFYWQLIPRSMRRLRLALYGLTAMVGGLAIGIYVANLSWCYPISRNWSYDISSRCLTGASPKIFMINLLAHIGTDLLIYILPFFLLPHFRANATSSQLVGIIAMFSLGFLVVLISIGWVLSTLISHILTDFVIWMSASKASTLIVICCPMLKRLWDCRRTVFGREISPAKRMHLHHEECRMHNVSAPRDGPEGEHLELGKGRRINYTTEDFDRETQAVWTLPGENSLPEAEGLAPRHQSNKIRSKHLSNKLKSGRIERKQQKKSTQDARVTPTIGELASSGWTTFDQVNFHLR